MQKPFAELKAVATQVESTPVTTQDINEIKAELARLQAENASLKAKRGQEGSLCKVTDKGGLSVYGLGRFPVTLYKSQWVKLIGDGTEAHPGMISQIQEFIKANADKLTEKPAKAQAEVEVA